MSLENYNHENLTPSHNDKLYNFKIGLQVVTPGLIQYTKDQ